MQLTPNIQISIVITFVLILTLSTLVIMKYWEDQYFEKMNMPIKSNTDVLTNEEFFATDFSNQRTIFLLGSSHVGHINATQVNNIVAIEDIVIYNLARGGDQPIIRLATMNNIISVKPEIIFYGISYRDFSFPYKNFGITEFPTIQQIDMCGKLSSNFYDTLPSNPQWTIRKIFKETIPHDSEKLNINRTSWFWVPNIPFQIFEKEPLIKTDIELKGMVSPVTTWDDVNIKNKNICALFTMISKFQDHKIKVVVFTTPLQKYYIESLSDSQKKSFESLKEDLVKIYGIKIYEFEEKYSELNIWGDFEHVSTHNNVTKYSSDIGEMIKMEIGS